MVSSTNASSIATAPRLEKRPGSRSVAEISRIDDARARPRPAPAPARLVAWALIPRRGWWCTPLRLHPRLVVVHHLLGELGEPNWCGVSKLRPPYEESNHQLANHPFIGFIWCLLERIRGLKD